ncbi:MAG: S6e family ribosomal protein, partial [Candidatus Pacearchaeota archaeon]
MAFKINIGDNGKTFHLESDSSEFVGKKIGDKIEGKFISSELNGYEFEITGTSDLAGFPGHKDVEGIALRRVLLKKGKFLKHVPHK